MISPKTAHSSQGKEGIPCTVLLPPTANVPDTSILMVPNLKRLCKVDVKKAKASMETDERAIKDMITKTYGEEDGFKYVNRQVEEALLIQVLRLNDADTRPEIQRV